MPNNPWKPSARTREPAQLMQPIIDSAGWTAEELEGTDAWVYHLSDAEVAEIHLAVDAIEANDLELKFVTREKFPLPRLSAAPGEPGSCCAAPDSGYRTPVGGPTSAP